MQITIEFKHILEYVLMKEEGKENVHEQRVKAIEVLANETALKVISVLSDNSDVEIRDFFSELESLGEIGEHHVAIEILVRMLELTGIRETGWLIEGFIEA